MRDLPIEGLDHSRFLTIEGVRFDRNESMREAVAD